MRIFGCFVLLCGTFLAATARETTPANDSARYIRTVAYAAQPGDRPRRLDRTWIFAERQLYGGHQNLLHIWADRPLFHNSSLRNSPIGGADAAFLKDVGILRAVGFDGFASLDHYPVHLRQLKRLGERTESVPGYSQMIVIPAYATEKDYPRIKNMILEAAKSPYTTRLDGKLVFWCYGGDERGSHERWAQRLRSDPELPPFLFIGDMPFLDIYRAWNKYEGKGERTPAAEVAAFRKKVDDAIRVLDGFQLLCTERYWDHLGSYERHSAAAGFYRDYLLPIAREVLARPENRSKLVGAYVRQGYVNKFTAVADGQYGTETLRNYLDEILLLNPDVLMAFEWNEVNENTHFQPTVANGTTYARVLHHYRALLDRKPFTPMAGDDTRIPNLIVSTRQALRLGEIYPIELLYLPDGVNTNVVCVQACIKDETGKVRLTLPSESFEPDRLKAVTYQVASEVFPDACALTVEVVTHCQGEKCGWSAFEATKVDATRCQNYLYTHHPLREMLTVGPSSLTVRSTPTGNELSASASSAEPLASFEILDGTEEVAAADVAQTFDRNRFVLFRGLITALDTKPFGWKKGTLAVRGAAGADLKCGNYPWEGFHLEQRQTDGTWRIECNLGGDRSNFFVLVPREQINRATLDFALVDVALVSTSIAEIDRLGCKAWQFASGVRLKLERIDDLPDVPAPLGTRQAEISVTLPTDECFPIYQSRAVSLSGKTWRGAPVMPVRPSSATTNLEIWSDYRQQTVVVPVNSDRIPRFVYRFVPDYGALLPCSEGRSQYAQLGGADVYAEPMRAAFRRKRIPADFVRADPVWEKDADTYLLNFDGHGSYLALPPEVIPRGSRYELTFEICPMTNGNYVLLRQQRCDGRNVGLQLVVVDGKLRLSHFGVRLMPRHFDTGLVIPRGAWSTIRIKKDFQRFTATINGRTFSVDYDRRADMFQGATFGGNIEPGPGIPSDLRPFKGLLRRLEIEHGS